MPAAFLEASDDNALFNRKGAVGRLFPKNQTMSPRRALLIPEALHRSLWADAVMVPVGVAFLTGNTNGGLSWGRTH